MQPVGIAETLIVGFVDQEQVALRLGFLKAEIRRSQFDWYMCLKCAGYASGYPNDFMTSGCLWIMLGNLMQDVFSTVH